MKRRTVLAAALMAWTSAWGQAAETKTTIEDQQDVAITAYNNGLALVRDTREIAMPEGELHLQFMDVAAMIRPETVSLRSLTEAGSVSILEQNYEYDLISPSKLMEKYVGKTVRLVNFSKELGFENIEAELLSINEGPIYRVGGQIFLGHPGNVVLPEVPDNLISKPTLVWNITNTKPVQRLEATYLTNGVSWQADYVVTLAKDDKQLDLAGWVTMNNQSGATFENAQLKLVAGEVNLVQLGGGRGGFVTAEVAQFAADAAMPQQEAFAEYHLYTMPRRTTIKQNQSKQLALLDAVNVACAKKYEYRGQLHFYSQQMPPMRDEHVGVFLEFENREANHLGIPLPAGVMRIYQEDSSGMLQFAGEDRTEHTPKDETITLRMGQAFDVIGDRVQTDYRVIANNVFEAEFEITLRNHKENDIVIDVVEPMPSDWTILQKTRDFVKKDSQTAVFTIPVKKDGEEKLTYRVRVTY